jgi:thiamine-phosphate pyrophosphorylase
VAELCAGVAGLYAVTPDEPDTRKLLAGVEAALAGGASAVQYRNKSADGMLRLAQARALLAVCRRHGRPLIINDHVDLALELNADGLHLGADDGDLLRAKARLGDGKILGASCYDRLDSALEAQRAGATYVAFGSFFASGVKPGAVRAPLSLLAASRPLLSVPIIAIGGITLDNAPRLIEAGADGIAVISALFAAPDVEAAARSFAALFGAIIPRA